MKISLSENELEQLTAMSDTDLASLIRARLAKFGGKESGSGAETETEGEDNDLDNTTTEGVTGGPREGEKVAQDSALRRHEANVRQAERDRDIEKIIPGYNRL